MATVLERILDLEHYEILMFVSLLSLIVLCYLVIHVIKKIDKHDLEGEKIESRIEKIVNEV